MTETIAWQDEYSVGLAAIDEQHQQLFVIFNKLATIARQGNNPTKVREILAELGRYVEDHFQSEELLFAADQELLANHRRTHCEFAEKIFSLTDNLSDPESISTELLSFLTSWLVNHIIQDDFNDFTALRQQGLL